VSFQEAVRSERTGETGVTRLQHAPEGPNEHPQERPFGAIASRGDGTVVSEGRLFKAEAAQVYGVSAKIVARWIERYQCDGRAGMADRSLRPGRMPRQTGRIVVERTAVSTASTRSFRRCYGSCYRSKAFARACRHLGLKHRLSSSTIEPFAICNPGWRAGLLTPSPIRTAKAGKAG